MWIMVRNFAELESDIRLKKRVLLEIHCKYNQILRITKQMI
jgi:hypothetical protein